MPMLYREELAQNSPEGTHENYKTGPVGITGLLGKIQSEGSVED
jgi:hypothetical protein